MNTSRTGIFSYITLYQMNMTRAAILLAFLTAAPCSLAFQSLVSPTTVPRTSTRTTSSSTALLASSNSNVLYPMKRGSTVALVTPFDPITGGVAYGELRTLLQRQVAAGTSNLCILGTTGESNTLSNEERTKVLTMAVEECKGKMTILAGTGTIDPHHVKEMTLEARDLGCDAALIVTPYYVKPPQRGLIKHFLAAAEHGLPVVIYNVPGRTGVNMLDSSIAVCAQHENIVGVKDATGDLSRLLALRHAVNQDTRSTNFLYYSGDDGTTLDFVLQGGDGCISVTANVAPAEMAQMIQLGLQGANVAEGTAVAEARVIDEKLALLHNNLFCEANPIPTKWALSRMGVISSPMCRLPLDAMDEKFYPLVEDALRYAGMLQLDAGTTPHRS